MTGRSIDFTTFSFPTDRLTVRDLRRKHPEGFDQPLPEEALGEIRRGSRYRRRSLDVILGDLIDAEREVAERAFHNHLGSGQPDYLRGTPDGSRDCLISTYVEWGLATGEHHAEQLVRDLEAQAISQAERVVGKPL